MILYVENSKDSTHTHTHTHTNLRPDKEFSKILGHKINKQNPIVCLYANNEQLEKEIKKIIPFTTASKNKIKYLGINLAKRAEDLYSEKLQNFAERN